jgi:hypothetical protein
LEPIAIVTIFVVGTLNKEIAIFIVSTDIAVVTIFAMEVDEIIFGYGIIEGLEVSVDCFGTIKWYPIV